MKKSIIIFALLCLAYVACYAQIQPKTDKYAAYKHPAIDAYDGWHTSVQAWSFNRFSFFEAVDKVASVGADWIEAYPGQRLSADLPEDVKFIHGMDPQYIKMAKEKLLASNVRVINYGVVGLPNDEAECRKVFEFAQEMGIECINSEPPEDAFDLIDKLAQEYKINVGIHNHPKPSHYWNPETVLRVVEGRSQYIGANCDIGHWMRSSVQPLDALKMLEGRIRSFHFNDLNEFGVREAHDVVWGTGVGNPAVLLKEIHRQGVQAVFSAEYEHDWETNVHAIRKSIDWFNKTAGPLNPTGWQDLFAKDFSNAALKDGSWTWDDGELAWQGGGYIWTTEKYGDFMLDLEYKLTEGANSGIFIRCGDLKNYVHKSIEIQIHDDTDGTKYGMNGAVYDCMPAAEAAQRPAGEWNHYTVIAQGSSIKVILNNVEIINMDTDEWPEVAQNPDGTKNKFKTAIKDMPRKGYIGLQDHGNPLWFRNLKIKKL